MNNRFTSSERRGTIAVLIIIGVIVAYVAIAQALNTHAPEAQALGATQTVDPAAHVTATVTSDSSATTQPRAKKSRRKAPTHNTGSSPTVTATRHPLDERVD